MTTTVDITDIEDKAELIRQLWNNTQFVGLGILHMTNKPNEDEIEQALKDNRADYITGKPIKICGISKGHVDPRVYDLYAGKGKLQFVVDQMKKTIRKQASPFSEEYNTKLEKSPKSAFQEIFKDDGDSS